MSKTDLYRLEEEQSLEKIADFLEQKARELREGSISFSNDLSLDLPEKVVLDIDVDQRRKTEKRSTSIEIELKWAE